MKTKLMRSFGYAALACAGLPIAAVVRAAVLALVVCLALPLTVLARDYDIDRNVVVNPPQTADDPMTKVGPGDMLTTPKERVRLEEERKERVTNPAAMDRQMDNTESRMGLEGRR